MPQVLLGLEVTEISELLGEAHPAFRARQIYEWVYRAGGERLSEITTLPAALRRDLEARFEVGLPRWPRPVLEPDLELAYPGHNGDDLGIRT